MKRNWNTPLVTGTVILTLTQPLYRLLLPHFPLQRLRRRRHGHLSADRTGAGALFRPHRFRHSDCHLQIRGQRNKHPRLPYFLPHALGRLPDGHGIIGGLRPWYLSVRRRHRRDLPDGAPDRAAAAHYRPLHSHGDGTLLHQRLLLRYPQDCHSGLLPAGGAGLPGRFRLPDLLLFQTA